MLVLVLTVHLNKTTADRCRVRAFMLVILGVKIAQLWILEI